MCVWIFTNDKHGTEGVASGDMDAMCQHKVKLYIDIEIYK